MARHKNVMWNLPENNGRPHYHAWESMILATIMDVRDELQRLNSLLHCHNVIGIPATLRSIRRNTYKPRKVAPKKRCRR